HSEACSPARMVSGRSLATTSGFPLAAARNALHVATLIDKTSSDFSSRRELFLARGLAHLLPLAGGVQHVQCGSPHGAEWRRRGPDRLRLRRRLLRRRLHWLRLVLLRQLPRRRPQVVWRSQLLPRWWRSVRRSQQLQRLLPRRRASVVR